MQTIVKVWKEQPAPNFKEQIMADKLTEEKMRPALQEWKREQKAKIKHAWDCRGCGKQYVNQPFRCKKCGSFSFEKANKE